MLAAADASLETPCSGQAALSLQYQAAVDAVARHATAAGQTGKARGRLTRAANAASSAAAKLSRVRACEALSTAAAADDVDDSNANARRGGGSGDGGRGLGGVCAAGMGIRIQTPARSRASLPRASSQCISSGPPAPRLSRPPSCPSLAPSSSSKGYRRPISPPSLPSKGGARIVGMTKRPSAADVARTPTPVPSPAPGPVLALLLLLAALFSAIRRRVSSVTNSFVARRRRPRRRQARKTRREPEPGRGEGRGGVRAGEEERKEGVGMGNVSLVVVARKKGTE